MATKLDRIKQMYESQNRKVTSLPVKLGETGFVDCSYHRGLTATAATSCQTDKPLMVWQADETKFFSENRQKQPAKDTQGEKEALAPQRDDSGYYISSHNTKRNPDLIIPGGAIKGNMYFSRDPDAAEEAQTQPVQQLETEDE